MYNPPKPVYQSCELIDQIDRVLTNILASSDNSLVLFAGDFNQLSDGLITQLDSTHCFLELLMLAIVWIEYILLNLSHAIVKLFYRLYLLPTELWL